MKRGVVSLTNSEFAKLKETLTKQGCQNLTLLNKIEPVDGSLETQRYDVEINEEEAETILDCMPIPSQNDDLHLKNSRNKIQKLVDKFRFKKEL